MENDHRRPMMGDGNQEGVRSTVTFYFLREKMYFVPSVSAQKYEIRTLPRGIRYTIHCPLSTVHYNSVLQYLIQYSVKSSES